jgi:hypothetical protein
VVAIRSAEFLAERVASQFAPTERAIVITVQSTADGYRRPRDLRRFDGGLCSDRQTPRKTPAKIGGFGSNEELPDAGCVGH